MRMCECASVRMCECEKNFFFIHFFRNANWYLSHLYTRSEKEEFLHLLISEFMEDLLNDVGRFYNNSVMCELAVFFGH